MGSIPVQTTIVKTIKELKIGDTYYYPGYKTHGTRTLVDMRFPNRCEVKPKPFYHDRRIMMVYNTEYKAFRYVERPLEERVILHL